MATAGFVAGGAFSALEFVSKPKKATPIDGVEKEPESCPGLNRTRILEKAPEPLARPGILPQLRPCPGDHVRAPSSGIRRKPFNRPLGARGQRGESEEGDHARLGQGVIRRRRRLELVNQCIETSVERCGVGQPREGVVGERLVEQQASYLASGRRVALLERQEP